MTSKTVAIVLEGETVWHFTGIGRSRLRCLCLLPPFLFRAAHQASSTPDVSYPDPDIGVDSLAARRKAQLDTADRFKVFFKFRFTDMLKDSGITFFHHMVDDAGIDYKPVHYDHGTGIAVADVDGDGLYDIYFVNQVGGNELWKNLGGGKFSQITTKAGVGLPGRISVTASFADIDNDGAEDLFVTTVLGGNALFKNDGSGVFKDITKDAGLDLVSHSSGSVFFDYDNDGLLDLLVCNVGKYTSDNKGAQGQYVGLPDAFAGHLHPQRYEYPVLYKNIGHARFKDVTEGVGLRPTGWCGDASFADLNGTGFPGLFILNMQGRAHYFENAGGKRFVDKTEQYFSKTPWGSMGVKFFDFDNDGRMDLFVTDMHSDMSAAGWSGARKTEIDDALAGFVPAGVALGPYLGQCLLSQPWEWQVRGDLRPPGSRELLALGRERGRHQCRRVGRRVHHVRNELPVPLRNQFDAPEQPGREVPGLRVRSRN